MSTMDMPKYDDSVLRLSLIKDIFVGILTFWSGDDKDVFFWEGEFGKSWLLYRHGSDDSDLRVVIHPDVAVALHRRATTVGEALLHSAKDMDIAELSRIRSRFTICWLDRVDGMHNHILDAIAQGTLITEARNVVNNNQKNN